MTADGTPRAATGATTGATSGSAGAFDAFGAASAAATAERRLLEDLVWRSSLGGAAMTGLCARTPAATAAAIVARAAARPRGLRAAWRQLTRGHDAGRAALTRRSAALEPGRAGREPERAAPERGPARGAGLRGPRQPRHRLRDVRYPRRRLVLAVSGAAVLVLFVVAPRVHALDPGLRLAFADLVPAAAAVASGVMCLHAARRRLPDLADHEARQLGRAWRLLGLAGLSWGAGELAWTWYELAGRTVPLPSLADVGFMLAVPLMTAALLAFPTAAPRHLPGRLRVLLDGLIIATSLLGLTWLVSIDVLVTGPGGPWLWDRVVSGFYPLGDVVNLSIAVAALTHARRRAVPSFGLITAGIALIAVSDLGFLYLTQHDAYASGGSIDLGWCVGFFLVGFAGLHRPTVPERPRRAEEESLLRAVLPHLSMGALVSAVGVLAVAGRPVDRELLVGTTAVVLLGVGRHVACLWENARMRRELLAPHQPQPAAQPPPRQPAQQPPERSG